MCFYAPHIFSKVSSWHTISTPRNNRPIRSWYLPLWCDRLLKLLWSHRWALGRSLKWLLVYMLWPDLLQWNRLWHWWPLWSWPNMLWYKLLMLHSTNTRHPLRLILNIPKIPLITIISITIPIIFIPLKVFKSLIIITPLNSRGLPKWNV
ncbi:hypothetical protein HanIR_Chr04g0173611 [Helianthus annuus]|nr:hypothetical protein HanIR_Chr04g0173611 [Helianthus annuus]